MSEVSMAPMVPSKRIVALDVLRGFALLGILLMNIQSFAMPDEAYFNPLVYGDMMGLNRWVWILSHVLADQKFMTIFSLLFGAGILLLTERLEARGQRARQIHYRRNMWLLLIGLIHAYFLWSGDILVSYAIAAFVVYWLRNLGPRWLVIIGLLFISVHSAFMLFNGASIAYIPADIVAELQNEWTPDEATIGG